MISTHNSAGSMESQRDSGTTTEISLIHTLMAKGEPVIITGDMNEHTEFFCRVSAATGWSPPTVAAEPGLSPPAQPAPCRLDHGRRG